MSILKVPRTREQGFTLIEVLVATFVFVMVISSVSQIFVSAFTAYRRETKIQNNLENAQFAMNTMAKELRGSSIETTHTSGSTIRFYNYGETTCFQYSIIGTELKTVRASATDLASCTSASLTPDTVVVKDVTGIFDVTASSASLKRVGKVVLSLQVGGNSSTSYPANIQTTVSLRDYEVSGL